MLLLHLLCVFMCLLPSGPASGPSINTIQAMTWAHWVVCEMEMVIIKRHVYSSWCPLTFEVILSHGVFRSGLCRISVQTNTTAAQRPVLPLFLPLYFTDAWLGTHLPTTASNSSLHRPSLISLSTTLDYFWTII